MNNKKYFIYTHVDSEITTLSEFVNETGTYPFSIANGWKVSDLLAFKGDTDDSNNDRIYSKYSLADRKKFESDYFSASLTQIDFGTKLVFPKNGVFVESLAISGENQMAESNNFPMFQAKQLVNLQRDARYAPVTKTNYNGGVDAVKQQHPQITVWIWCRAINRVINVSHFISSLNTTVEQDGGGFSFDLSPIKGAKNYDDEWTIDLSATWKAGRNEFVSQSSVNDTKNSNSKRAQFFFHNVIRENDVVFIRFETLELEEDDRILLENRLTIDPSNIPATKNLHRNYDMIGLVDNNIMETISSLNDVNISISGRDLTKLIIDDGTYFFPTEFAQSGIVNAGEDDEVLSRMITTKKFYLSTFRGRPSIRYVLQFVLNFLTKVEICPTELFASYGSRRTKVYKLEEESQKKNEVDKVAVPAKGIWQIVKLLVDKSISTRRVTDSASTQEDGSIINYFYKVCQQPFVEFFGDTYGDQFYFIVRQPPFNQTSVRSFLDSKVNTEEDSVEVEYESAGGVVSGDNTQIATFDTVVVTSNSDSINTITNDDVLSETLEFQNSDFFNIFQLRSSELVFGVDSTMAAAIMPMITIPELVKIHGSRRWVVESNYMTHSSLAGQNQQNTVGYIYGQALRDLKFMIDSNIYLPFTRRGSIVINGDRRIKRGTWIRYRATGEIFYVDAVENNASISNDGQIDRTTTITVSRGMVEAFIGYTDDTGVPRGTAVEGVENEVSYFNIVRSDIIIKYLQSRQSGLNPDGSKVKGIEVEKSFTTNKDVLEFFIQGRQFGDIKFKTI